jgi:hypothetical protein
MRFMMLLPAPVEALEKCAVPDRGIITAMRKYDEEMKKAGVLLSEEGLHPTSKGVRIKVSAHIVEFYGLLGGGQKGCWLGWVWKACGSAGHFARPHALQH